MDSTFYSATLLDPPPPLETPPVTAPSRPEGSVFGGIARIGLPVCLQNLVSVGSGLVVFVLLGRYADEEVLAGFALANVLCNLLGRWLLYGLGAGFDTIASQAWGAEDYRTLGVVGQRVTLIMLCFICVPLTPMWWYASPILEALGQPHAVAEQASLYARISLPGLYLLAFGCVMTKALLAMGKARIVMISSVAAEVVTVGLLVLLVVTPYRMALEGAAIASVAANGVQGVRRPRRHSNRAI